MAGLLFSSHLQPSFSASLAWKNTWLDSRNRTQSYFGIAGLAKIKDGIRILGGFLGFSFSLLEKFGGCPPRGARVPASPFDGLNQNQEMKREENNSCRLVKSFPDDWMMVFFLICRVSDDLTPIFFSFSSRKWWTGWRIQLPCLVNGCVGSH